MNLLKIRSRIRTKLIQLILIFSLPIIVFGLIHKVVFAQNNSNKMVSLSPALVTITANPGEKKQFTASLINNSDNQYDLEIQFLNIDMDKYLNEGKLIFENNLDNPAVWLYTKSNQLKLTANTQINIDFELQIPIDIKAKGYYPAIVYSYKLANETTPRINLENKLVTVVYLNIFTAEKIEGIATSEKSLEISSFSVVDQVVFPPGALFNISYKNSGVNYIQPRGVVKIYDRTGKLLSSLPTINDSFGYLVQGQQKSEGLNWQPIYEAKLLPDFGEYTAVAEIYENPDQKVLVTAKTTFLVLPVWHILGLIGITLALLVLIRRIRTKGIVLEPNGANNKKTTKKAKRGAKYPL